MHATCLVCTLKRSPEPSNSESLAEAALAALRAEGVTTDVIRLADHRIDDGTPIAYNRVAGVVVVGNEDGAHHCISEVNGALNDIGYTLPGQNWTYWNKGPGPGEEEWPTTQEREWSTNTGRTAAQNLLAVAQALQRTPVPAP
jgi:multimeric flavodoxin WrbA